ncbi:MAG: hypothetical protein F6K17_29580 [Okeania sp. SIO3C4]|nr:hypothetical protein [Okeania sp. SIO3B3]NER06437.1 hypothetical protein [Okeania sp. SIO3C4]
MTLGIIPNIKSFAIAFSALVKRVYDINLNYLGRPSQSDRVRRKERRRKSSRERKFFVYALIRTRYHTSFHQCHFLKVGSSSTINN